MCNIRGDCEVLTVVERTSESVLKMAGEIQSATLHEALGKRGAMSSEIKPVWPDAKLCGSALTVEMLPGDNLLAHKALTMAEPGDVLVIDCGAYKEAGIWGEILTVAAIERGVAGLVTNGAVRDTVQIRQLGFPVFAGAVSIKGTTKTTGGRINREIVIGGVCVAGGDMIVADADGVVVVGRGQAKRIVEKARERELAEAAVISRLKSGEQTMDILGFREAYLRLGLKEGEE